MGLRARTTLIVLSQRADDLSLTEKSLPPRQPACHPVRVRIVALRATTLAVAGSTMAAPTLSALAGSSELKPKVEMPAQGRQVNWVPVQPQARVVLTKSSNGISYNKHGNKHADKCAWKFGTSFTAKNGSKANVTLGSREYYIQQNWLNANGGYCTLSY